MKFTHCFVSDCLWYFTTLKGQTRSCNRVALTMPAPNPQYRTCLGVSTQLSLSLGQNAWADQLERRPAPSGPRFRRFPSTVTRIIPQPVTTQHIMLGACGREACYLTAAGKQRGRESKKLGVPMSPSRASLLRSLIVVYQVLNLPPLHSTRSRTGSSTLVPWGMLQTPAVAVGPSLLSFNFCLCH